MCPKRTESRTAAAHAGIGFNDTNRRDTAQSDQKQEMNLPTIDVADIIRALLFPSRTFDTPDTSEMRSQKLLAHGPIFGSEIIRGIS